MNTELAKENLVYLYCITAKLPKLSRPAIETKAGSRPLSDSMAGKEVENLVDELYFIYYQGLYAIVSKVKVAEFGEQNLKKNLADLEWVKEKATTHEKVIEGIMKQACVIPFKFGTLFNSENNLRAMLKEHLGEFKKVLKHLKGKEEWGVKIYADLDKLKENLLQEDQELLKIDKEISASSTGKAFLLKKKKEELLNTVINRRLNEYGQDSFERLNKYSVRARINKLLPKEVTERKDEMILNSAFLVEINRVKDLLGSLENLKEIYTGKGLFFDCTGPWPPYNFCTLEEKKNE